MSHTASSAIATCTIEGFTDTESVALAVYDYLVNHPDEIPLTASAWSGDSLDHDDMDSDRVVSIIKCYMDLDGDKLTISYHSENEENYSSQIFDFLTSHFATLQSSPFMKVNWMVDDSRDGMSSGTDYYGKDGSRIDVDSILSQHFAN